MEEKEQRFRIAAVGGFHKQDVLRYIEAFAKEHTAKLEGLQQELTAVQTAAKELERERTELTQRLTELSTALEGNHCTLTQANTELEIKSTRLSQLEEENRLLKNQVAVLTPNAEAYHRVKDRAAGIELDAHCRAQAAEAAAQAHVKQAKVELEQWFLKVQSRYDRLRTDVDATIAHAGGELERVGKTLEGISVEFSTHDAELEKFMDFYQEIDGPHLPAPLKVDGALLPPGPSV